MPSSPLSLPPIPASLKPIAHYLKTASEHATRDPVITYWCRLSALENGLKLDKKSKEALALLMPLMDWLEKEKKVMCDEEAVTSEVVASAHVENYAVKLFLWADKEDRASHFNKNVVKAFYSCGILFDVLTVCTHSELSPENAHMRKYAKWKAAYIHNCLKNGDTPMPGPMEGEEEEIGAVGGDPESISANIASQDLEKPSNIIPQPAPAPRFVSPPDPVIPAAVPQLPVLPQIPQASGSSVNVTPAVTTKAQKYCKYAISALDYDDSATAILNLTKALKLLQTGEDS